MDVGLPDIDGHEAVRIERKNGFKAPIIMLTGHDADSDTILGLELGRRRLYRQALPLCRAACAHPRPASPARRARTRSSDRPVRVSARLEAAAQSQGQQGPLTEKESSILRYLYRAGQRPVSRGSCCRRSGATTRKSPRTRSRRHMYRLGKRSSGMPPIRPCCSLKRAATNWCLDRRREDRLPQAKEELSQIYNAETEPVEMKIELEAAN